MIARRYVAATLLVVTVGVAPAAAQNASPDWMRGLDELMSREVTSVAKKDQRVGDTSAAVYVITREEIRRSGIRTVPELLRLVPGMHVGRIDTNEWAISARGMNGIFANKLLVMIDGRSIYTPYFAGVFWDAVDVPVQAIERIEVQRGPGASVWGANAVNGVVNIITAGSPTRRETTVTASVGHSGLASLVHEGRAGDRIGYRVFGDVASWAGMPPINAAVDTKRWNQQRVGGSLHATVSASDAIDAEVFGADSQAVSPQATVTALVPFTSTIIGLPSDADSWSGSLRWTRQLPRQGYFKVAGFADDWRRLDLLNHHRHTRDLTVEHRLGLLGRHDLLWGADVRTTDEVTRSLFPLTMRIDPAQYDHHLASGFVQDEIRLFADRTHVTVGAKAERRDEIGWSLQPTVRANVRLTPTQSVWAAVSRAIRAPDRVERSFTSNFGSVDVPGELPMVLGAIGNAKAGAEWLTAYEAGYRAAPLRTLSVDLAGYYNRYDGLLIPASLEPRVMLSPAGPYLLLPISYQNVLDATTVGGEALVSYTPMSPLKLTGGYTLFTMAVRSGPAVGLAGFDVGGAPRHEGQLRAALDLPRGMEVDAAGYAVGAIPALAVPSYTRVDLRLGWHAGRRVQLSAVGQNLFGPPHIEFYTGIAPEDTSRIRRRISGLVAWRF